MSKAPAGSGPRYRPTPAGEATLRGLDLVADLVLFGAGRGGLSKPVQSGLRPSFHYAGQLVACEVWADDVDGFVPLEVTLRARIRLPYAKELGWAFTGGERFELRVASQRIGEGVVVGADSSAGP